MKIIIKKPLKKKELKEFIFEGNTYDWEQNYVLFIQKYIEGEFKFNSDERHCEVDGLPVNDMTYHVITEALKISGMDICDRSKIKRAIMTLSKMNCYSIKGEAREQKRLAKEQAREQEQEQKRLEKQMKQENKKKQITEQFTQIREYILKRYGDNLCYNIEIDRICYGDKIITGDIQRQILADVKREIQDIIISVGDIKSIIYDVAKEKKFKNEIIINESDTNIINYIENQGINEDNWEEYLEKDKQGIKQSFKNYVLYLSFHPNYKGKLKFDTFNKMEFVLKFDKESKSVARYPISDKELSEIKGNIDCCFGSGNVNQRTFEDAVNVVLLHNSENPFLNKLVEYKNMGWDGKKRVHKLMVKYFGCDDVEPVWEMTEVMLCGALQRIVEMKPNLGTSFDYCGIMFGAPGLGKTSFIERLHLGSDKCCINPNLEDKQSFTDLTNRVWCVLFDEFMSIEKADYNTVKTVLTEKGTQVRLSYARRSEYYPRHNVFWANTNYEHVLKESSYERRFLCFECKNKKPHTPEWWKENYTDYDIQQIWAEVWDIYNKKYAPENGIQKVIQISEKTKQFNNFLQNKHYSWRKDIKPQIDIQMMLESDKYSQPFYGDMDYNIWDDDCGKIRLNKVGEENIKRSRYKYKINFIKLDWIVCRSLRSIDYVRNIISSDYNEWEIIELDGDNKYNLKGNYCKRKDVTLDNIMKNFEEWEVNEVKTDEFFSDN